MKEEDVDKLIGQIRRIILNKPVNQALRSEDEELMDLQDAISYLADCLSESNEFLKNLSRGNLAAPTPSRHNFLASNLKELQSGLRHLTWQANQVANGDYGQRVDFMGEFSESFNSMAGQLEERENALKEQADALTQSMALLIAIMDGLDDWVVVTAKDTETILYTNYAAQEYFYNPESGNYICGGRHCDLMHHLRLRLNVQEDGSFDYTCKISEKTLHVKNFSVQWQGKMANVHFISDITHQRVEKEQLENLAFKDDLTGLYNRRYGMQKLKTLILERQAFSVCMIDLDGLKKVNDEQGHLMGDDYITTITEAMRQITHDLGTICRVGGDEFLMIFPDCSEAAAREKVRQLEENVASLQRSYVLSISCGVLYVSGQMNLLPETVLERVDEEMYAVKKRKKMQQAVCEK